MRIKKAVYITFLLTSLSALPSLASGVVTEPSYVTGSTKVYEFNTNNQYVVYTSPGAVTDIQLRPDEKIQKVAAGNSLQWAVDTDVVAGIYHLYVKPLVHGIETNMIVNTSKRSYRFILKSRSEANYFIAFTYPKEDLEDTLRINQERLDAYQRMTKKRLAVLAKTYDTTYKVIENKNVGDSYLPTRIYDDGVKTYIEWPDTIRDNMPVIYYYDEWDKKKLQLVNYRIKGGVMTVDKVLHSFRIVYSQTSFLRIQKGDKAPTYKKAKDIHFTGDNIQDKELASLEDETKTVPFYQSVEVKETQKKDAPATKEDELSKVNADIEKVLASLQKETASPKEEPSSLDISPKEKDALPLEESAAVDKGKGDDNA